MSGKSMVQLVCILLLMAMIVVSCGEEAGEPEQPVQRTLDMGGGFHGWESHTLRNMFVQMDVVPELGGKIMGYSFQGYQVLWHDPQNEGLVDHDQGYGAGEKWVNPGGAKVWPAPQGAVENNGWPGPPDNILDAAPYDIMHENGEVTVVSPEDNAPGRTGLQYRHTYSLREYSSVADLHLTMQNVVDRQIEWSLWHLATLPVDRPFTVYVPVDEGNWHVMHGDENNPQWRGVENGLFRASYEGLTGKVGMSVREGWAAWHDEENDLVFAVLFPLTRGRTYPDRGSQVEIWMNGASEGGEPSPGEQYMELEVLGPMEGMTPGSSATFDINWAVCRCSNVVDVLPVGVVAERPVSVERHVDGKLGVFYSGKLRLVYLDAEKNTIGYKNLMDVNPVMEINISIGPDHYPSTSEYLRLELVDRNNNVIGAFDDITLD